MICRWRWRQAPLAGAMEATEIHRLAPGSFKIASRLQIGPPSGARSLMPETGLSAHPVEPMVVRNACERRLGEDGRFCYAIGSPGGSEGGSGGGSPNPKQPTQTLS